MSGFQEGNKSIWQNLSILERRHELQSGSGACFQLQAVEY